MSTSTQHSDDLLERMLELLRQILVIGTGGTLPFPFYSLTQEDDFLLLQEDDFLLLLE